MAFVYPKKFSWETSLEELIEIQTDPILKQELQQDYDEIMQDTLALADLMEAKRMADNQVARL